MPQMAPHIWIILANLILITMMMPMLSNKMVNKKEKTNSINKYNMSKTKW